MRRLLVFACLLWLAQLLVAAGTPTPLELLDPRTDDADLFEPGGLLLLEALRLFAASPLRAAADFVSYLLLGQFLLMVASYGIYWAAAAGLPGTVGCQSQALQAPRFPPGRRPLVPSLGPLLRFVLASQLSLVAHVAYAAALAAIAMVLSHSGAEHGIEFSLLSSALLLILFVPLFVLLDLWRLELAASQPLMPSLSRAWRTLSRHGWPLCTARFALGLLLATGPGAIWLIAVASPSTVPSSLHLISAHAVTFGLVAMRALWLHFAAAKLTY